MKKISYFLEQNAFHNYEVLEHKFQMESMLDYLEEKYLFISSAEDVHTLNSIFRALKVVIQHWGISDSIFASYLLDRWVADRMNK